MKGGKKGGRKDSKVEERKYGSKERRKGGRRYVSENETKEGMKGGRTE